MFKIFIKTFLIILCTTFFFSAAFAADWVPIGTINGKEYQIDMEDFKITGKNINYTVRNADFKEYIFDSDCKKDIILSYLEKGGEWVYPNNKPISDTMEFLAHSAACKIVNNNPLAPVNTNVWWKYFNDLNYNRIPKAWKPKYTKDFLNLSSTVEFEIDKAGKIVNYEFISKCDDEKFNKSIEKAAKKLVFAPLPEGYDKNIRFRINFKYANQKYSKIGYNHNEINHSNGYAYITVGKEKKYVPINIIDINPRKIKEGVADTIRAIIFVPTFMFVTLFLI